MQILGMAMHIAAFTKCTNYEFRDGMGLRMGNGISPCFFFFAFSTPKHATSLQPHMKVTHPLFILVATMGKVNTSLTPIVLLIAFPSLYSVFIQRLPV